MLNNKNYCDENTCVALRELGYNYPQRLIPDYFGVFEEPQYDEKIHLYDAQKWLREEKEVYVTVIPEYNEFGPVKGVKYRLEVAYWKDDEFGYETIEWLDEECPHTIITFDSYEDALSEGIKEAVKILKEK
jgi:hypothetical protein